MEDWKIPPGTKLLMICAINQDCNTPCSHRHIHEQDAECINSKCEHNIACTPIGFRAPENFVYS